MRLALALSFLLAGTAAAETVVANRIIRAQEVIAPGDVRLDPRSTNGAHARLDEVIGQEARVAIYPGHAVMVGTLGRPALIARNQMVELVFSRGTLRITTEGRALGRAAQSSAEPDGSNVPAEASVTGSSMTSLAVRPSGKITVMPSVAAASRYIGVSVVTSALAGNTFVSVSNAAEPSPSSLPLRKSETHVVLLTTATCTANDPTATAERNSGMPTVGFTTSQIFELFIRSFSRQPSQGVATATRKWATKAIPPNTRVPSMR